LRLDVEKIKNMEEIFDEKKYLKLFGFEEKKKN
jgi:hypothetical protein